jgi:hypothetical protein
MVEGVEELFSVDRAGKRIGMIIVPQTVKSAGRFNDRT